MLHGVDGVGDEGHAQAEVGVPLGEVAAGKLLRDVPLGRQVLAAGVAVGELAVGEERGREEERQYGGR